MLSRDSSAGQIAKSEPRARGVELYVFELNQFTGSYKLPIKLGTRVWEKKGVSSAAGPTHISVGILLYREKEN